MFHMGTSHFATYQLESGAPCFGTPSRSKGVRGFSTPLQGVAYVPGKGIPLWIALLRKPILPDGMVHYHSVPDFKVYRRMS